MSALTSILSSSSYSPLHHLPCKNTHSFSLPGKPRTRIIHCSSTSATSFSSISTTHFDLKTYWSTLIAEIDEKLDEAIQVEYPNQIYEAMRYSVLAQGAKRAPPVMCVAACELLGGDRRAAFPTACALEMVRFLASSLRIFLYIILVLFNVFNNLNFQFLIFHFVFRFMID